MTWRIASFFNENFFIYLDDSPTRRVKKDSQTATGIEANVFGAVSWSSNVVQVKEASGLFRGLGKREILDAGRGGGIQHVDDALVPGLRIGANNHRIFAAELLDRVL